MDRKRIIRVTTGIALAALGAFMIVSLATRVPHEGPFPDFVADAGGGNACGIAGAYVSAYAFALIGRAAYLVAAAVGIAGVMLLIGRGVRELPIRISGLVLVTGCLIVALAVAQASPESTAALYRAAPGAGGGVVGILLAGLLYRAVGATGTLILLASGAFLGMFLLAGAELLALAGPGFRLALGALGVKRRRLRGEEKEAPKGRRKAPTAKEALALEAAPAVLDEPDDEQGSTEDVLRPEPEEPELVSGFYGYSGSSDEVEDTFKPPEAVAPDGDFQLPPLGLLEKPELRVGEEDEVEIRETGRLLERTLSEFKVDAVVERIQRGPVITMFEIALAAGTKLSKVASLSNDLAIALKAPGVRVVAPLPGRDTIGIEVPNAEREIVRMRELMEATRKDYDDLAVPLFLGKDTAGSPMLLDLARCPHLLVAGATGSGKSVSIKSMISSILMTRKPDEVQLLLIDPKSVEFSEFVQLPHLICPVLTDMKKAASVLKWACKKMDERFSILSRVGVRNLAAYNALGEKEVRRRLGVENDAVLDDLPFYMPHVVIIVDEFGELMMVAAKEVENAVTRLSQKARAVGIHLICATQRPSTDVITGLIKANLPARISFQTSSMVDSRTILDRNGAEVLLGRGDMLLLPPGRAQLVRAQGTFVSDAEVLRVVEFLENQATPRFHTELQQVHTSEEGSDYSDALYDDAVQIVVESRRGSVSLLQRRLSIGYSRAARLIDMMAENGIVGPYRGSQARRVLLSKEEWEKAYAEN
ncbi:MAG: DNA translocase FtsK 4TM domain-containing protein [Planctomycetes bacterium]|nr:DNA translocase FtsK 4TM domain-containing protein [Planctomycetota bacterium]